MMRVGPNASAGSEGTSSSRPHANTVDEMGRPSTMGNTIMYVRCKGPMQLSTGMLPSGVER